MKENFILSDDNFLSNDSNPDVLDGGMVKSLLDDDMWDILTKPSGSMVKSLLDDVVKDRAMAKSTKTDLAWVLVELPLYVGQKKVSEVMELMKRVYGCHGDDDTGSLYKVQDALDGFVFAHDNHIRKGDESGTWSTQFDFQLKLPSENHANILASWPRVSSDRLGYVTINLTARVVSMFFIGYDLDQNDGGTPLRLKLHIECKSGCANHVENVLVPLLKENGTFYVVGAADLADDYHVETFEISKLGFVDVLSGQEQILLN